MQFYATCNSYFNYLEEVLKHQKYMKNFVNVLIVDHKLGGKQIFNYIHLWIWVCACVCMWLRVKDALELEFQQPRVMMWVLGTEVWSSLQRHGDLLTLDQLPNPPTPPPNMKQACFTCESQIPLPLLLDCI